MNKAIVVFLLWSSSLVLSAANPPMQRAYGWCEQGAHTVTTGAVASATRVQQSYPGCGVKVYVSGSQGVVSGAYQSGGTISGSAGQTCTLSFPGGTGGTASVTLTGVNSVNPGRALTITNTGKDYTSAPTTATLSSGSATCSGTATITSALGPAVATIYADDTGSVSLSNPFNANQYGYWYFYVIDGKYDVQISGTGLPVPFTYGAEQTFDYRFLYPATGSLSRTVKAKLADTASVLDFGCKGDGTTDDTVCLQTAINYSVSAQVTMYVPKPSACYRTTDTLTVLGNGLKLVGYDTHEVGPAICFQGTSGKDIIKVGNGNAGPRVFNTLISNIWLYALGGCANAVQLANVSEGRLHVYIGNSSATKAIGTGVYCNDCGLFKIDSTILEAQTGIKLDSPPGGFRNNAIYVSHANLFEVNTGILIREGQGIYITETFIENYDTGIKIDNASQSAGANIDNLVISNNFIDTVAAPTHPSPIAFKLVSSGTQIVTVTAVSFHDNDLLSTPASGGSSPYVMDFDLASCSGCSGKFSLSRNIIAGGTTSSLHGTAVTAFVFDQGFNQYRTGYLGPVNPVIVSGTLQFLRQDYGQVTVFDPRIGQSTLLTVQAGPSQGTFDPMIRVKNAAGNVDWEALSNIGIMNSPDPAFAWSKVFGTRDPADNVVRGFGVHGPAAGLNAMFVGPDLPNAYQTWWKATGNSTFGVGSTDDGLNAVQVYGGTRLNGTTISVGVNFSSLPTCNAGISGTYRTVLDSTTQVWGATVTGGGGARVIAWCNGSNWTVFAK